MVRRAAGARRPPRGGIPMSRAERRALAKADNAQRPLPPARVKLPPIKQVNGAAHRRGLYVMVEGKGNSVRYEFWSIKTGKLVLTYNPLRKWYVMPGIGNMTGEAENVFEALEHGIDKLLSQ